MYLRSHDWATIIEGAANAFEVPKITDKNQIASFIFQVTKNNEQDDLQGRTLSMGFGADFICHLPRKVIKRSIGYGYGRCLNLLEHPPQTGNNCNVLWWNIGQSGSTSENNLLFSVLYA